MEKRDLRKPNYCVLLIVKIGTIGLIGKMRISIARILVYLAIGNLAHGQTTSLDSLRRQLSGSAKDTDLVNGYYLYGIELANDQPDSALHYYHLAKELSKELGFHRGQAAYASHAIDILNNRGKFREALDLANEALRLYEDNGTQRDRAVALINVGSEWHYLSDFQLATDYYLKALKIVETIGDKRLQRTIHNNLASIFINLKDYAKGKAYAENSLALAKELQNDYAISSSTYNIATAELYLKDYGNALKHYTEIIGIAEKTDDYIVLLDGWLGSADVYNAMNDPVNAERFYTKVINLSKEKEALEYEMFAYMGRADMFRNNGQLYDAMANTRIGINLAHKLGTRFELKDLYLKASELDEKSGKYREALGYRKLYESLNDSLVGEKSQSNIRLLEAKFESEKKEATIANLESERQLNALAIRQKNLLNSLLLGTIAAVTLVSFLLYRNYGHKQKLQANRIIELETERQLSATEAVLKGEEQERARLAKDLHDGLGGMLSGIQYSFQTIKGNMVMTQENHLAFERTLDMLNSSIKEMRRVAHNMMPESLLKFGLDVALKDFCNEITKSGSLRINYVSIGLKGTKINDTLAITTYRIVQELVHNTIKHAKAEMAIVQITKTDKHLTVTVEDDGQGFDTLILKRSKGIGWRNIEHRVEFLKGSLNVDSEYTKGTSVHIEFDI